METKANGATTATLTYDSNALRRFWQHAWSYGADLGWNIAGLYELANDEDRKFPLFYNAPTTAVSTEHGIDIPYDWNNPLVVGDLVGSACDDGPCVPFYGNGIAYPEDWGPEKHLLPAINAMYASRHNKLVDFMHQAPEQFDHFAAYWWRYVKLSDTFMGPEKTPLYFQTYIDELYVAEQHGAGLNVPPLPSGFIDAVLAEAKTRPYLSVFEPYLATPSRPMVEMYFTPFWVGAWLLHAYNESNVVPEYIPREESK